MPGDAGAPLPGGADVVPAGFVWRNHSLLGRLLRLIDSVELNEDDPERLASLSEMDHLATRIWRNSDSALVLAGHEIPRRAEPLALVELLRAAASEIEEYGRVTLDVQHGVHISGSAAADTVHLVAELLENATRFSPETAEVAVSGHAVCGGGSLITITDNGAGLPEEELTLLNQQLVSPSAAGMTAARPMGLSAVALLAARHGVTVTLSAPPDGGTTAEVYLPAALISLDTGPGGGPGRVGEALWARASEKTAAGTAALGHGPPIFESVRSGYLYAFGRDLFRASEQRAGQSPARRLAGSAAAGGDGSGPAVAAPQAGDRSGALPHHVPQPGQVRGAAAGHEAAGPGTQRADERS